jgi:hypothetical protein
VCGEWDEDDGPADEERGMTVSGNTRSREAKAV